MERNPVRRAERRQRAAMRISTRLLVSCTFLGALSVTSVRAAEADAIPSAVSSILDEQSFAVVAIDAKRLDLDAVVTQIAALPILSERDRGDLSRQKKQLSLWLDQFRRAGGHDIWIVLTLADELLDAPLVVVPLEQGSDRQALESLFVKGELGREGVKFPWVLEAATERKGALVLGTNSALKRIQGFNGPLRAIPREAVEAVSAGEVRAFLLPTNDQRRVLSEFLRDSQLEQAIANLRHASNAKHDAASIARTALRDGLQWAALGATTHDGLRLKLVVGSKDASSAQALALWVDGAWQLAKQHFAAEKTENSQAIAGLIDQLAGLMAPKIEDNRLTVEVDTKQVMATAVGALLGRAGAGAAQRGESRIVMGHLKQLALAMHNYHDVNKHFPPAVIRDPNGKPLLSWRVMLLPYLEQNDLYKQFHLDEPWDSAHNKALIAKMPDVFAPRSEKLREQGKTTLVVPIGKQTIFDNSAGVPISDITDGTSNTILIINADDNHAVVWTKPDDLYVDVPDVRQAVFGSRPDIRCAFADGSAQALGPEVNAEQLRALLTRNGGEAVSR